ncbi:MAG: hypothetical protein H6Q67_2425 [Firmicutes bacterium]|nr:hypothetical protein [Bacillota bacterium]
MYRDCRKAAGISLLTAEANFKITRDRIVRIEYGEEEAQPNKVVLMDDLTLANIRRWQDYAG